ncbi:hypothetical protein CWATWH8502_2152 [Crocosphaera watsonii WH 8502]|uniref:Uncharacterized protein n=2 Tax=Crocosphaera watsonii TaxID=263511 RepID=T2IJU1_CROWT|nr:hypothetical protein CWATWH8502_2152 [Crocosphaera watsonii WH 8502]
MSTLILKCSTDSCITTFSDDFDPKKAGIILIRNKEDYEKWKNFRQKNHLIKVVLAKFNKLTILSEIILICPLNKLYVKNIKDRYFYVIIRVITN